MVATSPSRRENPDSAGEGLAPAAAQIAWELLSSGRTLMVLGGLLAALLLAGSVIAQGADRAELLASHDYATALTIGSLGLDHAARAWPTLLVLLLLGLNIIGLGLRHVVGARPPQRLRGLTGPGVARVEATLAQPTVDVARRALSQLGLRPKGRDLAAGLALRSGLWTEGVILVLVGLLVLGTSLIVAEGGLGGSAWGLDGRATLLAGDPEPTSSLRVRDGEGWIGRSLAVALRCDPADPADALRRRVCELSSPAGVDRITLGAGRTAEASGLSLRLRAERPMPLQGTPALLLREGPGASPAVLRAEDGRTYALADETRLTAFTGPDGPLVIAREPGARPILLAPTVDAPQPLPSGLVVTAVPAYELTLDVLSRPQTWLALAAAALLALGLLLMALVPHLSLSLVPVEGGTELVAVSLNRPQAPARLLAALRDGGAS